MGGEWVWVDTCCIDKRSSAELTEAINSMFKWYADARKCIVYLNDVPSWRQLGLPSPYTRSDTPERKAQGPRGQDLDPPVLDAVKQSAWFRRGWTLQELLAPDMLIFCNNSWGILGHVCKSKSCHHDPFSYGIYLNGIISGITYIPSAFLNGATPLSGASIAQRMSWASRRITTRPEDEAYCLLGIFNVNMPMVYGEGRNAFRRLQLEIIQRSADQSIFAWTHGSGYVPIFATSPAAFAHSAGVTRTRNSGGQSPHAITNNGLRLQTELYLPERRSNDHDGDRRTRVILLACEKGALKRVAILLVKGQDRYYRYIPASKRSSKSAGRLLRKSAIYVDTGVEDTILPAHSWSERDRREVEQLMHPERRRSDP